MSEVKKGTVKWFNATKGFGDATNRVKLRDEDIKKIVSHFEKYDDVDKYCHVAHLSELEENEFNLNVPRYVDISEPEESIDIQKTYDQIRELELKQEKECSEKE